MLKYVLKEKSQKNLFIEIIKTLMIYVKSYITMKETPYYLQNGIFLKIPSHTLRDMEQIQFYFEHV